MKYGKFTHILSLLATIPQPLKDEKGDIVRPYVPQMTVQDANQAFDIIFEYIHANFAMPVTAGRNRVDGRKELQNRWNTPEGKKEIQDCDDMLTNRKFAVGLFVEYLETIPPYFSEILFPVCVARYMLRDLYMPINHREAVQFNEFHNRYGTMILG